MFGLEFMSSVKIKHIYTLLTASLLVTVLVFGLSRPIDGRRQEWPHLKGRAGVSFICLEAHA